MPTTKIFSLLIAAIVAVGCRHTHKPQASIDDLSALQPRVLHEAVKASKDSLDFILSRQGAFAYWENDKVYHQLSTTEMNRARTILEKYVADGGGDTIRVAKIGKSKGKTVREEITIDKPLPLSHYYKQYVGFVQGGHILVDINLASHVHTQVGTDVGALLQREYYRVDDGGIYFGRVLIDLTEGKVIHFSLNGVA